jgi:type IV pilus assembly protein PilY1
MKRTNLLKVCTVTCFLLLACLMTASNVLAVGQTTYVPTMGDYCALPPFLSGYVPPQVLFTLGKDHKFYYPAYNDASDINNDGMLDTTYMHSFDYYGYFDSHKCYAYASGVFTPFGITTDKYCSSTNCTNNAGTGIDCSGKFSGNFLNWAAMSRADVVKMVIYGGYRTSDNNGTNYAEVSGEFIPQDGHIWGKEYLGADSPKLFANGVANKRALICVNGTAANGKNVSQIKIIHDASLVSGVSAAVTTAGGLRAWNWINVDGNADMCADNRMDLDANGTADNATLTAGTIRNNYNVSVRVCDPAAGYNYLGDWERKHCKNYSSASPQDVNGPWRPVGLMQVYGETPNSVKVCSKDMSTACNNDGDCSGASNGQCVNASNMFFGLIAGSFQNPKSGGYIRKDIYSINEETNQNNGTLQTSVSSGKGLLMKSIEEMKCPTTYPLSTHLGNPIGEILYEGLRYWAGRGTPTADFISGIGNGASGDNGIFASQPTWDKPATLFPSCSIPFNLVFSDIYNSFDHDQVPGSSFPTSPAFTGDLTGFDATALSDTIWANENLGTPLVVGESGTTAGLNTDGRCGGKTVTGLGNVKGICPAEGNQSGSYYAAAAALYGHNYMNLKMKTANVLTYVVAFNSNVPVIQVYTSTGKSVMVEPYGKSVSNSFGWSCTTTNTTFASANYTTAGGTTTKNLQFTPINSTSSCPTLAQVSFYVLEQGYNASNQLNYIKYRVATDDLGGGDFDLDMLTEYTVCAAGAANAACNGLTGDQVTVKVERAYSSAGNPAGLGFTIVGAGADSGTYMTVQHTSAPPAGSGWAGALLPTTSATMKFIAAGSATLPKPPLWYAAKYGGFRDSDGDGLPFTDATCSLPLTSASRNSKCNEWTTKIPGVPDNYFEVSNPSEMENKLRDALEAILARVSSGTAASILNNSEGSGASLLQAVFYPRKDFDATTYVNWIGELHSIWYYLDPHLQNTSIREDSNQDNKLNLTQDSIAQFYFDTAQNKTLVRLFSDANGDGVPDLLTPDQTIDPDSLKSLWKAGRKLWTRSLATSPRLIYTHTDLVASGFDDATTKLTPFGVTPGLTSNVGTLTGNATFLSLIQTTDTAKAAKLISWTHGNEQVDDGDGTRYRSRLVQIDACNAAGSGCQPSDNVYKRPWKLGDIVSSTPKLVSNVPQNSYHKPVPEGYKDDTYAKFTQTANYKNRGMVFVGSNSGMLHAFRLGVLHENSGKFDKAQFNNSSGTLAQAADDLGREEWAFIPKQALPYLTYIKDPNYCHIYGVDKSSTIVDVAVKPSTGCVSSYWDCSKSTDGSTWETILIGGMGTGGAAKWNGNGTFTAPTDSVKTPIKNPYSNPDTADKGIGYSSYFALDVTDPTSPRYLWEFPGTTSAVGEMGYSTTGPVVVRVAANTGLRKDNTKNGRWFAVFASGPTGPIDTVKREFKGQSDQQLKIYVVDVADGTLLKTITQYKDASGNLVNLPSNAFAGSLAGSMIDTDRFDSRADGFYSDDNIYIGFVKKDTLSNSWTKGGVIRLSTNESIDPTTWTASMLIDNIGPVTSSVTKLQDLDNQNLWLYFGTGRYFMKGDDTTNQQALYGVKDPCYSTESRSVRFNGLSNLSSGEKNRLNKACYDPTPSGLIDQSGSVGTSPQANLVIKDPGWFINLDLSAGGSFAERMITDPVAARNGAVFFTTFKPSNDVCRFGGDSIIWAVKYNSGSAPPGRSMQGKALMQVSTGAFAEIDLKSAFSNPGNQRFDGRRLAAPIPGVPPTAQGLSLITSPHAIRQILHVREK